MSEEKLPVGVWVREWRVRMRPRARDWFPGYRPWRCEVLPGDEAHAPKGVEWVARVWFQDGSLYDYGLSGEEARFLRVLPMERRGVVLNQELFYVPGRWVRKIRGPSEV